MRAEHLVEEIHCATGESGQAKDARTVGKSDRVAFGCGMVELVDP